MVFVLFRLQKVKGWLQCFFIINLNKIIIIIITVFITRLLPKDTKRQVLLLQGVGAISEII